VPSLSSFPPPSCRSSLRKKEFFSDSSARPPLFYLSHATYILSCDSEFRFVLVTPLWFCPFFANRGLSPFVAFAHLVSSGKRPSPFLFPRTAFAPRVEPLLNPSLLTPPLSARLFHTGTFAYPRSLSHPIPFDDRGGNGFPITAPYLAPSCWPALIFYFLHPIFLPPSHSHVPLYPLSVCQAGQVFFRPRRLATCLALVWRTFCPSYFDDVDLFFFIGHGAAVHFSCTDQKALFVIPPFLFVISGDVQIASPSTRRSKLPLHGY